MYPVTYVNNRTVDTLTRPANATPYTVGQVVGNTTAKLLVFPVAVNKRGGYIPRVSLITDKSTHTEALRLWLFNTSLTAPADQSAIAWTYAQGLTVEGYVDFTAFAVPTGASFAYSEGLIISRPLQVSSAADNNLFGILEARAAFTPSSGQQFAIEVYTEYSA